MNDVKKFVALDLTLFLCLLTVGSCEELVTVCQTFNFDGKFPPKCVSETVFLAKSTGRQVAQNEWNEEQLQLMIKSTVEDLTRDFTNRLNVLYDKVDQEMKRLSVRTTIDDTAKTRRKKIQQNTTPSSLLPVQNLLNRSSNRDCHDLYARGVISNGVYNVTINGTVVSVYCDMEPEVGGWTVFQKRDITNPVDFNRKWNVYKEGFGKLDGDFWLGLDKIHNLTKNRSCKLRIDIWNGTDIYLFALYSNFSILDESDNYKLLLGEYIGTAGDGLTSGHTHHYVDFSTKDRENDRFKNRHCAAHHEGGWWFNQCFDSCLTCRARAFLWDRSSIQMSEMKLLLY